MTKGAWAKFPFTGLFSRNWFALQNNPGLIQSNGSERSSYFQNRRATDNSATEEIPFRLKLKPKHEKETQGEDE